VQTKFAATLRAATFVLNARLPKNSFPNPYPQRPLFIEGVLTEVGKDRIYFYNE
jgi:hypothetical protein